MRRALQNTTTSCFITTHGTYHKNKRLLFTKFILKLKMYTENIQTKTYAIDNNKTLYVGTCYQQHS